MDKVEKKSKQELIQINGNGLFTKGEVNISISKAKDSDNAGIVFLLKDQRIPACVDFVSNTVRNTVLSNESESICLIEHFLAACSLFGISDIEVKCSANELVFNDGSAVHYFQAFKGSPYVKNIKEKYDLKEVIFLNDKKKQIVALPHNGFKISYFMDYDHPALGKLFGSWEKGEDPHKLLRARTFAPKDENNFFGLGEKLLSLDESSFNKKLHEPLEPVYHKILDIIGDLRLSGINPLEINMHVIGFKSGHTLNVELAKELKKTITILF